MPTISDVANRAGVSIATVSRVINNISYVNKTTKLKVLKAIEELHYSPSYIAQWMRAQKTKSFGVLIPDFTNIYYSLLLKSIEAEARRNNYLAIICTTEVDPDREKEYVYDLIKRQVEGIILCWYKGVKDNKAFLREVSSKIPVLMMDQSADGLPISSVYTDGYTGIKNIISYLTKKGHKKIALIKSLCEYSAVRSRFEGYLAGMKENNMELHDEWIIESDFSIEGGFEAAQKLLGRTKISAIVTIDDLMALGALKYASEAGLSVPDEIAITGFDDIPLASLVTPGLTTIAQPVKEMALAATRQLIKKMENRRMKSKEYVFPPKLIIRGSA